MRIYKHKKPSKQTKDFVQAWAKALAVAYIKKEAQCKLKEKQAKIKKLVA